MNEEQKTKSDYSILKLKEQAPIQDVIKNYYLEKEKAENNCKQQELDHAYCNICNQRQEELYRYYFHIFLQKYQSIFDDPKKLAYVIKEIKD